MNVEAIIQPSEAITRGGGAEGLEGTSGIGDFSTSLREAIGDEDASSGAQSDADQSASSDAQEDAPKQFVDSELPEEPAEETEEADRAEEAAAESARIAAETGELSAQLSGRQVLGREGAGLSEAEQAEGTPSALDSNRSEAAGDRPTRSDEERPPIETQGRSVAARSESPPPIVEASDPRAASISEETERRAGIAGNAEDSPALRDELRGQASQEAAPGVDARQVEAEAALTGNATEAGGERAAEIAAAPTAAAESLASRPEETSVRPDSEAGGERGGEGTSQDDREGSNASRDFAEEQAGAEQRQSLAEGEARSSLAAEAAAAYAAASGNVRPDEAVAVDGGIAVAGPVAVTAPETASAPTAPTANAPQPAAASDAIAVQTEWLATRGGGSARLTLHPADLGEIEIRVSLRGGVVDVVMVAQEAVTQALAEEQSERLTQAFANRDLRMDSFEVRRGDAEGASNQAREEFAESPQQGKDRNDPNDQAGSGREGLASSQAGGGSAAGAPVMPQIIATGPEASVDLRI